MSLSIPTPHIEVDNLDTIAKTVIMPGDPLRAKYIAQKYLENVELFNQIRNMLGYTGMYKGTRISVMAHGMGMPSIGIYSYELFNAYKVDTIIRVGSCGSYKAELKVFDLVLLVDSYSESTYAKTFCHFEDQILNSSQEINEMLIKEAKNLNYKLIPVRGHCSDVFYRKNFDEYKLIRDKYDCSIVEMEAFALFANAKELNKKAACIATISDSLVSHEITTAKERQTSFDNMIKIALETAIKV